MERTEYHYYPSISRDKEKCLQGLFLIPFETHLVFGESTITCYHLAVVFISINFAPVHIDWWTAVLACVDFVIIIEQHSEHPDEFTGIYRETVTFLEHCGIANDKTDSIRGLHFMDTICKSIYCSSHFCRSLSMQKLNRQNCCTIS